MNKEKSFLSLKDEAFQAIHHRNWEKALTLFQRIYAQNPNDLRAQRKIAEILERLGRKEEALLTYRKVAEAYAKEWFLIEAISLNKMIPRIDPFANEINHRLAQFYQEKLKRGKSFSMPFIFLLSDLEEKELQSFLNHLQIRTFRKGELILDEGEERDSLMILSKGEVKISKRDSKGREVWIRDLRESDCFGEFGFFVDQKRHAKVMAKTDCELLEIPRTELEKILRIHPRVKEVLNELYRKKVLDPLLALSPLFSSLEPKEREEVLKRFKLRVFPPESLLFKGGETSKALYVIKRGEVKISTQDSHRRRVSLGRLGSGNFFGEIGVLMNTPRMAFAETTQRTELLELPKDDLDELCIRFPKLQEAVKEISSRRLVKMKEVLCRKVPQIAKEVGG
ncbi:MAG: cyclic nucleotide-binding domain-containing protein [Thermodesulfobacteriota bacterium]